MTLAIKQNRFVSGSRALLGALALVGTLATSAAADESAKWFVVRHDTTGACWTAMLIKANGEYVHAFAQTAGGPYDTKKQAREREAALENEGVCAK